MKTGEGFKDLIHEAEAAIQAAEDGKHEMEENAEQFENKVALFTENYILQQLAGEGSQSLAAEVIQKKNFEMLQ